MTLTSDASRFLDPARQPRLAAIADWLLLVAALVFVMVVVGGITRLTESGLSIVHWEPVKGVLPPLSADQWQAAFDAYRETPQYEQLNHGMSLAAFKQIFFWEYVHRLLGRIIGLAFALPFLWFAWKKAIPKGYGWRLVALLALGGLQGAIGWWMVASGLVDKPEVSHIRLAIHLLTALFIFAALIWTALDLATLARDTSASSAHMPTVAIWTLSLLGLQFMFGAYVAGLEAGYAFNSWPLMGGEIFPAQTPMLRPFITNLVDNPIVVQFIHRWLAFLVAGATTTLAITAWRRNFKKEALLALLAIAIQILLGIATILTGVKLWLGVAHQGMAAILLAAIILTAHRLGSAQA